MSHAEGRNPRFTGKASRRRFFVKFAWSRPAAPQLAHEISVLAELAREPAVPFLPEAVASSTAPLLLITRRVPGASLFDVAGSIDRDCAARRLVRFPAAVHHAATRQRIEADVGTLTGAQLPPAVTTAVLRDRFGTWIRPDQRRRVIRWCDWADVVLAALAPPCSCTATCMATTRCVGPRRAPAGGGLRDRRNSRARVRAAHLSPVGGWVPAWSC
jgi:hypothetical protein